MGEAIGAIIAAIVAATSGIISNVATTRRTERANQMNKNMQMQSMLYDSVQQDKANDYNSPKAQIQRNIDAGINPLNAIEMNQMQPLSAPTAPNMVAAPSTPIDTSALSEISNIALSKRAQDMDMFKAFMQDKQFYDNLSQKDKIDMLTFILNANNSEYDNLVKAKTMEVQDAQIKKIDADIAAQEEQIAELKKQNAHSRKIAEAQQELERRKQHKAAVMQDWQIFNDQSNRLLEHEKFGLEKEKFDSDEQYRLWSLLSGIVHRR